MPPTKVMNPVISPLLPGWPRPVSLPSSLMASEKAILIAAPTDAETPTKKATLGLLVAKAAAKIGANVDTDPSISPRSPGWTVWRM